MKKAVLTEIAAAGGLLWFGRRRQTRPRPAKPAEMARMEGAAHRSMMSVIVPAWIAAGCLQAQRRGQVGTAPRLRADSVRLAGC